MLHTHRTQILTFVGFLIGVKVEVAVRQASIINVVALVERSDRHFLIGMNNVNSGGIEAAGYLNSWLL
jgi:hypothetical protein